MIAPLINKLKNQGGTLYTFSSASRDLSRTLTDNNIEFTFSKFACLNIPNIRAGAVPTVNPRQSENAMYIQSLNPSGHIDDWSQSGLNTWMAEHLQNYVMNFETYILNGSGNADGYDSKYLPSVAEPLFFNWVEKLGATDFRQLTNDDQYVTTGLIDEGDRNYYYEFDHIYNETDGIINSDKLVQYLGDIDIMNQADVEGDTYTELYLHIPADHAKTPKIIFRDNPSHKNFLENVDYPIIHGEETGAGRIIGRTTDGNISTKAYYDMNGGGEGVDYTYSTSKAYTIDFTAGDYYDISNNSTDNISSIADYNATGSHSFEFNAILLYYTLRNKTTAESVTNLYGVLFVDNITDTAAGSAEGQPDVTQGYIQRYPKYKNTPQEGVNGNSFGLKVDLKIDTTPISSIGSTIIHDESSLTAMTMFLDATAQLQAAIDTFQGQSKQIRELYSQVETISNIVCDLPRYSDIVSSVQDLQRKINTTHTFNSGYGMKIDTSNSSLKFINSTANYAVQHADITINTVGESHVTDIELQEGPNIIYCSLTHNDTSGDNLCINIKYSNTSIQQGQSIRVVFDGEFVNDIHINIVDSNGEVLPTFIALKNVNNSFELVCIDIDEKIVIKI